MARYLVTFLPGDPIPKRTKYIDDAVGPPDADVDWGTDGVSFGSIVWDGIDLWFCVDPTTAAAQYVQISGGEPDDQTAAEVPFTPAGSIAATDTQAAVVEAATDAASALSSHAAAGDPHTGYVLESALAASISAALAGLGVVGPLLISDTHSTPIVFGDLLLTEEEDDFLYADT